ncbi:unnamed protein product [Agarophyton chilense]
MALTVVELLPLAVLFMFLIALVGLLQRVRNAPERERDTELPTASAPQATPRAQAENAQAPRRRRGGLARMQRDIAQAQAQAMDVGGSETESRSKGGKKKEARREAKREAQQARQAALERMREREAQLDEERREEEEAAAEARAQEEEEARKVADEREKKEKEEYESWRHLISVADEGEEATQAEEESEGLLERFCAFVRGGKVVVLEDLAAHFGMKTEEVIDRLSRLEQSGELSGFFDDRGKFIYVSREEMEEVARFIEKRGRISIQELAMKSSQLLHLDGAVGA